MQFRLCALSLSLLLCLPAVAEMPKPAPPAATPSAAYHWHPLALKHIGSVAAAAALHWNAPTATLPAGVERVYAMQSNHSLLLRVTDAGFAEATRLVQTVDLPPAAKPDAVPQVRLQVSFISASVMDVDNLGVPFDPAPYSLPKDKSAPQVIQLKTASGNITSQLYQTVMRKPDMVISLPVAVTTDKVAVKFGEDMQIPYLISHSSNNPLGAPPMEKKMRRLQTSLSITPRVNSDGSVTLVFVPLDGDLNAPLKAIKVPTAKTVSSGQVVALTGLPFSKEKQTDDQELLVFVTPTVLGSPAGETEVKPPALPQVRLQADFVGASRVDVDNLGVPFDPAPAAPVKGQAAPETAQLRTATGNIVLQLYQTLTRTHSTGVHAPIAITTNNVPAKIAVDSHIPYIEDPKLRETRELTLQASVTITPRSNSDGSVTVQIVTQAGDSITRTVPNGQMMVVAGLPLSMEKRTDDQELLVFVTPTVLGSAAAETEVKPPATPIADTGQPDPPMPGITDTPAEAKRQINVDVYNADLGAVTAMLQTQIRFLINLQVGGRPFRAVSVHLEHATPSQVLRAVARSAGAVLTRKADGEYIFSSPTPSPAQSEAAPGVYGLYTVVLSHATSGEMLSRLFQAAPSPITTLVGSLKGVRTVGTLPGNNALRVEATEEGLRRFQALVSVLDPAGRQIRLETLLVGVPATRTDFSVQAPPAALLVALRTGAYRIIPTPAVTATEDRDTTSLFYYTPPPARPTTMPPKQWLLIRDKGIIENYWQGQLGTPSTFRLTPHFGDNDEVAFNFQFGSHTVAATQPVRLGRIAVAELPPTPAAPGERLFFFVRPTLLLGPVQKGQAVMVTP